MPDSSQHSSFDISREMDNLIAARDGGYYGKSRGYELNVVNAFRSADSRAESAEARVAELGEALRQVSNAALAKTEEGRRP